MKIQSLVFKISFAACGIVCTLLILALAASEHFKQKQDRIIEQRYLENIREAALVREKQEKEALRKNIRFNTETLSRITAKYLYDFDTEELKAVLPSYMHYAEIMAIGVYNENNEPVTGIWKTPDPKPAVKQSIKLPGHFNKHDPLSLLSDSIINNKKVGYVQIWYSDKELKKNITGFKQKQLAEVRQFRIDMAKQHKDFRFWQRAGILFIILILSTCLIACLKILILKPLAALSDSAISLSELDLSHNMKIKRKDEIGQLFHYINNMINSLREIVAAVHDITGKLNISAIEIMKAIENQTRAASRQSSSVSEISSAMTELTSSSSEITEHSSLLAKLVENALMNSKKGMEFVEIVLEKMDIIHKDNQESITELTMLGKKSEDIAEIMNIINTISDQTKIIAFNAAIEASAAGNAGKRFGVVASEIRRLAADVTDSTGNIENKLNEIINAIYRLIDNSQKASTRIRQGVEYSDKTVLKLREIVNRVRAAAESSIEIHSSTQQQNVAEKQINTELLEIKNSAAQTFDTIKHISSISQDLTEMSADLSQLMNEFILDKDK